MIFSINPAMVLNDVRRMFTDRGCFTIRTSLIAVYAYESDLRNRQFYFLLVLGMNPELDDDIPSGNLR